MEASDEQSSTFPKPLVRLGPRRAGPWAPRTPRSRPDRSSTRDMEPLWFRTLHSCANVARRAQRNRGDEPRGLSRNGLVTNTPSSVRLLTWGRARFLTRPASLFRGTGVQAQNTTIQRRLGAATGKRETGGRSARTEQTKVARPFRRGWEGSRMSLDPGPPNGGADPHPVGRWGRSQRFRERWGPTTNRRRSHDQARSNSPPSQSRVDSRRRFAHDLLRVTNDSAAPARALERSDQGVPRTRN